MSLKETACVFNIPSTEQTVIVYQCLIPTATLFQLHVLAVNFELACYTPYSCGYMITSPW